MTYCFLEFVDVDSALRALKSSRSLMLNGRRLTVKPREVHKRVFTHQKRKGNCGLSRAGPEPMEVASLPPTNKGKVPSAIGGVQFTSESVERLEQAETVCLRMHVHVHVRIHVPHLPLHVPTVESCISAHMC